MPAYCYARRLLAGTRPARCLHVARAFSALRTDVNTIRTSTTLSSAPAAGRVRRPGLATSYLAMDLECVHAYSISSHPLSKRGNRAGLNLPAHIALVNHIGDVVYDTFIQIPKGYSTNIVHTGDTHINTVAKTIRGRVKIVKEKVKTAKEKVKTVKGKTFAQVQAEVKRLIKNRHLVLHAAQNDLNKMQLTREVISQLKVKIHDTQQTAKTKDVGPACNPSLKLCAKNCLGVTIQRGRHNPVEDARAAMCLFHLWTHESRKRHAWLNKIKLAMEKQEGRVT